MLKYDVIFGKWYKLFIKEEKGEVLSHVALMVCPMLIEGQWYKIGALHGICTKAAHRRRGLATELIQEALQWAKERCEESAFL